MVSFEFIPPSKLKRKYKVFGNFYNVEQEGRGIGYRNDLHIIDRDYFDMHGFTQNIKLLVIMMNPGESTPVSSSYCVPYFTKEEVTAREHCLDTIPTKPDRTQYQVMRMMNGLEIKHGRVINISDIRDTQSDSLSVELESGISDLHSIFSEERQQELQNIYSTLADDAFIFLAWGRDIVDCEPFKQLVERCILTLPQDKKVLGIPGEDYWKYKHPWSRGRGGSPRKWLQEAENCFNEYYTNLS
ncbi:hypothetical protein LAV72_12495 [Lysinibacillus xylanilyticus]|uniref:hypothetical protein n=1 Tax=Lysinibacillus xylanilyticus TaxID=582475 RepID=UPI002B24207C|nr:hypothetical protein [Lysinibacillus xylanilyticus]MEB2300435.1 hypothetical protein [Lysinibacillus xylanilyticus]